MGDGTQKIFLSHPDIGLLNRLQRSIVSTDTNNPFNKEMYKSSQILTQSQISDVCEDISTDCINIKSTSTLCVTIYLNQKIRSNIKEVFSLKQRYSINLGKYFCFTFVFFGEIIRRFPRNIVFSKINHSFPSSYFLFVFTFKLYRYRYWPPCLN